MKILGLNENRKINFASEKEKLKKAFFQIPIRVRYGRIFESISVNIVLVTLGLM